MATRRAKPRTKAAPIADAGLRERLIAAALSLVERDGARGVTLRAVGARAGVSRSAPYLHFESREALLAAVAEQGMRTLEGAMSEALERSAKEPIARLRALGIVYVTFAAEHPGHFRVMFGPEVAARGAHEALDRRRADVQALLADAFGAAQRAIGATRVDPRIAALLAWSLVHGLACLWVDGRIEDLGLPTKNPSRLSEQVTDALIAAIAPSVRR